jgi:phosphoglycerol transferase MdoB-like AlkP superfamily enzyme
MKTSTLRNTCSCHSHSKENHYSQIHHLSHDKNSHSLVLTGLCQEKALQMHSLLSLFNFQVFVILSIIFLIHPIVFSLNLRKNSYQHLPCFQILQVHHCHQFCFSLLVQIDLIEILTYAVIFLHLIQCEFILTQHLSKE